MWLVRLFVLGICLHARGFYLASMAGAAVFIRATIYLACVLECGVVSSRREKPVAEIFYKTSEWSGGKGEAECVNRLPPIFICAHIRAPGVTRQV